MKKKVSFYLVYADCFSFSLFYLILLSFVCKDEILQLVILPFPDILELSYLCTRLGFQFNITSKEF